MTTTLAYPHIEKPDGSPAHLQRVPRVRVAQIVMDSLAHGWSAEEMCRQKGIGDMQERLKGTKPPDVTCEASLADAVDRDDCAPRRDSTKK
ncbi:MAG TPA: hypothetical protein VFA18_20340 [Gemmataceae bacterium]|nr:hypothetical protein [Gemmataceae bacterium]